MGDPVSERAHYLVLIRRGEAELVLVQQERREQSGLVPVTWGGTTAGPRARHFIGKVLDRLSTLARRARLSGRVAGVRGSCVLARGAPRAERTVLDRASRVRLHSRHVR